MITKKMRNNCLLCNATDTEKDQILYEDNNIIILPTKYMKGHHKRIMAVLTDHVIHIDPLSEKYYLDTFIGFCRDYFDEEPTFALVDSTYATVIDHWHRIACDWKGTRKEKKQLSYTPHESILTKIKWSPR